MPATSVAPQPIASTTAVSTSAIVTGAQPPQTAVMMARQPTTMPTVSRPTYVSISQGPYGTTYRPIMTSNVPHNAYTLQHGRPVMSGYMGATYGTSYVRAPAYGTYRATYTMMPTTSYRPATLTAPSHTMKPSSRVKHKHQPSLPS
jgi:hypothetical protein